MRPAPESGRFAFAGAGRLWSSRFVTRLARALASGHPATGILLERRSGEPRTIVGTPDARAGGWVREAAAGCDGRLDVDPDLPMLRLVRGLRLGALRHRTGGVEERGPRATSVPPIAPAWADGGELPSVPWAIQVHLESLGAPGFLAASVRLGVDERLPAGNGAFGELVGRLAEGLRPAGIGCAVEPFPSRRPYVGEWRDGSMRWFRPSVAFRLPVPSVGELVAGVSPPQRPRPDGAGRHTVVFGGSGAGKTTLLARWTAEAMRREERVVVVDVHGDLGPDVLGRLGPPERRRVITLDAGASGPGLPGVDLFQGAGGVEAAAHLVAALRRSSDDDGERYWGFRLERIFDEFVRLTLEEGGNLRDLYDLLTDERRREAARLATRSMERARFLEELRGILRRNPEFLWPAAARLSKLVLSEPLCRTLAPRRSAIDLEDAIRSGRSVIVRLPIGRLGPEASHLAATLLVARVYLGRTAAPPEDHRPVLLVLDEAQSVAPALLAEILSEGRKFGVTLRLATQYPARLEGRLREAAAGSASRHVVLRTPRAGVASVAPWLGLSEETASELLPTLSEGSTISVDVVDALPRLRPPDAQASSGEARAWAEAVATTADEFGGSELLDPEELDLHEPLFRLRQRELAPPGAADPPPPTGPGSAIAQLERRGYLAIGPDGVRRVTEAGRTWLGEIGATGAIREGVEHRALLAAAYRIFARRGERLEIVRQGRFDTRLPDARLRWLTPSERARTPVQLAELLAERQRSWAYRAFGGLDVFVEAEVSGAERRERIRRDLGKAGSAGAHCLFLVGDPAKGRRIRGFLNDARSPRVPATVWVLRPQLRGDDPTGGANPTGAPQDREA